MSMIKVTGLVIVTAILFLGLYDVYAFMEGGTTATISHVIMSWSYDHPAFTFFMGFLMGHFFWRIRVPKMVDSENAGETISKTS